MTTPAENPDEVNETNETGAVSRWRQAVAHWASIATIVGFFVSIVGLVFSAGYFVARVSGDLARNTSQEAAIRITALEAQLAEQNDRMSDVDGEIEDQRGELQLQNGLIADVEAAHNRRYDRLRSQGIIQAEHLCKYLPDATEQEICLLEIRYITACTIEREKKEDIEACVAKPELTRTYGERQD